VRWGVLKLRVFKRSSRTEGLPARAGVCRLRLASALRRVCSGASASERMLATTQRRRGLEPLSLPSFSKGCR
jgi:hypothetical protein